VHRFTVMAAAGLVAVAFAIAGCGGSAATNKPQPSVGDGGATGAGSSVTASVCTKISQADVQALLSSSITSVSGGADVGVCDFHFTDEAGAGFQNITFNANDPDKSSYNNLTSGAADHAISGIGDEAYWNEPAPGQTTPELAAHKGNATCVLEAEGNPNDTTLKVTPGIQGQFTVADSDALAYVQLMGKVCNDVFAAL
jgi:hypothetical protein